MLVLTLLLAQAAPPSSPEIIVRGRRTREALEACVARRCPTPDDVRIAIAHAEAQFAQGRYREAQATLSAAVTRQRGSAARFPRHIAALYEAGATVNLHLGDVDRYRRATIARGRTLRENLPEDDPEVLLVAVRLGDFWIKQRQYLQAKHQFEAAARGYARRGDGRLAALTELRVVTVDIARRDFAAASDRLGDVVASPAATDPGVRQLGAVLRARLATARGKDADVDALLQTLRTDPTVPPMLVRSGRGLATKRRYAGIDNVSLGRRTTGTGDTRQLTWADIGFMVGADGRVADAEVLRGNRLRNWTAPYLAEIADRQYAPIALPPGSPGVYRVERISLRAERIVPTGHLMKLPAGAYYAATLDMTSSTAPPPPEAP